MVKNVKKIINVKNVFDLFYIIKINYKIFFLFFFISFFSFYYYKYAKNLKFDNVSISVSINNPYAQNNSFFYDILELLSPRNSNNDKNIFTSAVKVYYDFFSELAIKNYSQNFNLADYILTKNDPSDSTLLNIKYIKEIESKNQLEEHISFLSGNFIQELNIFAFGVSQAILVNDLNNANLKLSTFNVPPDTNISDSSDYIVDFLSTKQRLQILKKIHNNFLILAKDKNYPQIYRINIKYIENHFSLGFIIFSSVSIATLLTFLLFYFMEAFKNQRN